MGDLSADTTKLGLDTNNKSGKDKNNNTDSAVDTSTSHADTSADTSNLDLPPEIHGTGARAQASRMRRQAAAAQ
eukprot:299930-Pyramimonas_sp.AAC.2